MTHEEFKNNLKKLSERFESEKSQLAMQCARSNNPYKIGDIIESDCGDKIEINKMQCVWLSYSSIPQMRYDRLLLTKTGSYNKKIKTATIFQIRIKKEIE